MIIRVARPDDAQDMLSIYAPFVTDNAVSFETEVPTETAFAERISSYTRTHPWLVAEGEDGIAGYAYASLYRERRAYQWSAECSVYVRSDSYQKGLATRLYEALFRISKTMGYRNLYAIITLPNERSVAFHSKLGFQEVGTFKSVGFKHGHWHDVLWMHRIVGEPDPQQSPLRFSDMNDQEITRLIQSS